MASLDEVELDGQTFYVPTLRENVHTHRCMCVLIELLDEPQYVNRCDQKDLPPDVPFCENCSARHPDKQGDDSVEVTVWNCSMDNPKEKP